MAKISIFPELHPIPPGYHRITRIPPPLLHYSGFVTVTIYYVTITLWYYGRSLYWNLLYSLDLEVMQMKIRHKAKYCMGHFDQQLNRLAENVRLILSYFLRIHKRARVSSKIAIRNPFIEISREYPSDTKLCRTPSYDAVY